MVNLDKAGFLKLTNNNSLPGKSVLAGSESASFSKIQSQSVFTTNSLSNSSSENVTDSHEYNYSDNLNIPDEKTVNTNTATDIDLMIQNMMEDFMKSIQDIVGEAIKDAIENGTNGTKETEETEFSNNVNSSKETESPNSTNDVNNKKETDKADSSKNNKAVFGDPDKPDWRNSQEIRDKIAAEQNAKFTNNPGNFAREFPAKIKDAQETDVDEIIGIHSEEDIKGVSGADLYELYSNFEESYGATDMNDIKSSAALVKILQYASKEQLIEFTKALNDEHPNNTVFSRMAHANSNCGVTSQEMERIVNKINEFNEHDIHKYFNLGTCGGKAVFYA